MGDQGVGNFAERGLNRLFILDEGAFAVRFGQLDVSLKFAGAEDGLRDLRNETIGALRTSEQAGELSALSSEGRGEADGGEISGFGYADLGVLRDGKPVGISGGICCSVKP
jgi:hypothetical protein